MSRDQNFLLGHGERLAFPVRVPRGGGDKNAPYSLADAVGRLMPRLRLATETIGALPDEAFFQDEAVITVTMHPRYVAKSDFPESLLSAFGLRAIGSRPRFVAPDEWGIKRHGESGFAEDIFVAGRRSAFRRWTARLDNWTEAAQASKDLQHVEDVHHESAEEKIVGEVEDDSLLEVVLHSTANDAMVDAFARFAGDRGAEAVLDLRRNAGGLTFLPVRAHRGALELAGFSFVRAVRTMPRLRPLRPTTPRTGSRARVVLPDASTAANLPRVVVFDGGIPPMVQPELSAWVDFVEPPGIGPADPEWEDHGLAVTSALLFGPARLGSPLDTPVCVVDHVRVVDSSSEDPNDPAAYVVLDRIVEHLKANPGRYTMVNISHGPVDAVNDNEVSLWTSTLDELNADGSMVVTVAAGNDGDLDQASGLHRVQPPADGVNMLAVGAADRPDSGWARVYYSSFGPGRSPGIVKPDGVAFGGGDTRPFPVVGRDMRVDYLTGTSFAAPYALRSAAAVDLALGDRLSPLAVRALLIHRAERPNTLDWREVGWGRFLSDSVATLTCDDDEAVVIYQGLLPIGEHLRLQVPLPASGITGPLTLTATLVIASGVDAEHASSYTRSGLEVAFRPRASRVRLSPAGAPSAHGVTIPFFSSTRLYGQAEAQLRAEAHKWELVRRGERTFRMPLEAPTFDVYYHNRQDARRVAEPPPVPYAFVLGMRAPAMPMLYNEVVRSYARVLEPLRPQVHVQVPGS